MVIVLVYVATICLRSLHIHCMRTTMATLFLDESGYTGQNLLDKNQPFFTLATLNISEEEAQELKDKHFGHVQSPELKFSVLRRGGRHLDAVAQFIRDLKPEQVLAYSFDKKYALLRKSIDYLIEPKMHEFGFNLYNDGGHIALANLYWIQLRARGGDPSLVCFLRPFQNAVLKENVYLLSQLEYQAQLLAQCCEPFLYYCGSTRAEQQEVFTRLQGSLPLDLAFTGALWLMSCWRDQLGQTEPLELHHDQSSNMAKQMDDWEFWMSDDRSHFQDERAAGGVQLPVGLGSTTLTNSKTSAGIQLADVLSGAINGVLTEYVRKAPESEIVQAVGDLDENERLIHMLPSMSVDPDELGTRGVDQNVSLTYMANELMNARG